ncbi:MAG: LacI family DNA-binding transcriptional regulator [Candidatus Dormiibacterota bacterium]
MLRSTRRPTQADVARLAGVSQALVSQVLNNATMVSVPAGTKQRVLAAAERLGYVTNRAARSLRTQKSSTIAYVIPDITNPFYPEFVRGIEERADASGYDLVTYSTRNMEEKELRALDAVQQGQVDGVIGVFFHVSAQRLKPLIDRGIAVVRFEPSPRCVDDFPLDCVYVNNLEAARTIVGYLVERGHRRIAMITGRSGPRRDRFLGYRRGLRDHGLDADRALVRYGDFRAGGGYEAMVDLLRARPLPTATFVNNDLMAIGALRALREAGLDVPGDMAVVGFDDIAMAALVDPGLTTIAQHPLEIGRRAAELLLARLDGDTSPRGKCEEIPFDLVVRQSA